MQTNCYIVVDEKTRDAIVIDPGDDADYVITTLHDLEACPTAIVATHGHFDHILSAFELQIGYNIPFLVHQDDVFLVAKMRESAKFFLHLSVLDPPPAVSRALVDGDTVSVGVTEFTILHTPGHTPGSICLFTSTFALVGDTLFADGVVGRTDFSYSDKQKLQESLGKILEFSDDTLLYPGHGVPLTVADAKRALITNLNGL